MKNFFSNLRMHHYILARIRPNNSTTSHPILLFVFLLCSLTLSTISYAGVTARADTVTMAVNEQITIAVLSNDTATDEVGASIPPSDVCLANQSFNPCNSNQLPEANSLTSPENGTISISNDNRSVIYTPNRDFIGTDSFVYAAFLDSQDSGLASEADSATVTIRVQALTEPTNEDLQLINAFNNFCDNTVYEDVSSTCAEFNNLAPNEQIAARVTLQGDQVSAQSTTTVSMARDQNANIGTRISQLRNNSSGINVGGLTINTESGKLNGEWFHAIYNSMSSNEIDNQLQTGGSAGAESSNTNFSPFGFFINGSISIGDKDSSVTERGYDLDSDNYTMGLDYRYSDKLVVGAAYGISASDVEFNSTGDSMENTVNNLFLYGSLFEDNFYLSTTLGYAFGDLDTARRIIFGGFNQIAKGSTDTSQILFQVNGSYDLSQGALSFGPYMQLDVIEGTIDSYTETNGGGFEIAFEKQDISSQLLTVGAQAQYALSYSWGVLLPNMRIEIKNEFNDSGEAIRGRFALDPTNTAFSISADNIDNFWLLYGGGVSAVFQHGLSAYVDFETNEGLGDLNLYTYSFGGRWELAF
ncbi:MAG: hypothetical protein ACJAS1_001035 [Oleiphilaceae bacterium]|jgi:uncharacterized protein YhjY with autotransporter beta-barrel domain